MSALSAFWFVIGGAATFSLGVAYAITRRAIADYREARDGLPGKRRAVWAGVRATIKAGAVACVVLLCLVAWLVHDTRGS